MSRPPSLLRVGLAAGLGFIVAGAVWYRLGPFYDAWLASAATALLPADLWLEDSRRTLVIVYQGDAQPYRQAIDTLVLHSGVVIVLALVASTPNRSWRWLTAAGLAVTVGFFSLHVVALTIFGLALRASVSGGLLAGDALIGFAIFWGLTPVVLGGAWAYWFWLPVFLRQGQGTALDPLASADRPVGDRD